jgi:tRNA(adenine34) deaminase
MGVGMTVETRDHLMMTRCIELSKAASRAGEYPYAAVICRDDTIVAESTNKVVHDGDVTRHAELVAISQAQKALGTISLDDCEIYMNAEPCAFCSYAIRESRIRRVVYALSSPHMGGVSKWNVLGDTDLSRAIPEVFAPPPEIVSGYMAKKAEQALVECNSLVAGFIKQRGLIGVAPEVTTAFKREQPTSLHRRVLQFLRRHFFDHFGRR